MATVIDRLLLKLQVDADQADKVFQKMQKAMLQVGLSFLFGGMALKRFFETVLKSIFETFLAAEGETSFIANQLQNLQASFLALKVRAGDAFADSGKLQEWVNLLQNIINRVNQLTDQELSNLVDKLIKLSIGATAMMVFGQALLLSMPFVKLLGFLIEKELIGKFITLLPILGGVFTAVFLLSKLFGGFGNLVKAVMQGVVNIVTGLVSGMILTIVNGIDSILGLVRKLSTFLNIPVGGLDAVIRAVRGFESGVITTASNITGGVSDALGTDSAKQAVEVNINGFVNSESIQAMKDALDEVFAQNQGSPQT